MRNDSEDFQVIYRDIKALGEEYPDGIVVIGGVAVYMHAVAAKREKLQEVTHDADFLISIQDYSSLRVTYEVTSNPRLGKSQIIRNYVDFDVYVEHQYNLAVPFGEALASSKVLDGVRVASLEHLLVLKTDAAISRARSIKGDKDNRDLIRIVTLMDSPDIELLDRYMTDTRRAHLGRVAGLAEPFLEISRGNAHEAKVLRKTFNAHYAAMKLQNGMDPNALSL